jgi:phosphoenolpyruvate carboxylase
VIEPQADISRRVDADTDALRADLERLRGMLGETLARQVGPHLVELVEEVRDPAAGVDHPGGGGGRRLDGILGGLDLDITIALVRAFTAYF